MEERRRFPSANLTGVETDRHKISREREHRSCDAAHPLRVSDRSSSSAGLRSTRYVRCLQRADSKNWTVCSSNHALRDAAQHQVGQAAAAVRAHDDQIGSNPLRLVEDSVEGRAVSDLGTDGHS